MDLVKYNQGEMIMKGKLITLTVLMIIGSNISSIFAYGGAKNTNLSGGMLLFFVPLMLGIVNLANKDETN